MRNEGDDVLAFLWIEETLEIGRAVNSPVVISHHKCTMPENFGRSMETTCRRLIAVPWTSKWHLMFILYVAGSTVLLPERLRQDVPVQITWSIPHPEMSGRMLDAIAKEWNVNDHQAAERLLPASGIFFQMDESDVRRIMTHHLANT